MKLHPPHPSIQRGHTSAVFARSRQTGTSERYGHWLIIGAWWLVLILGLFFLVPDENASPVELGLRAFYLLLVAGMTGLLLRRERHRSHQVLEHRDTTDQLLAKQRGLLHALIKTQEQERKHMAAEWHDRLGAKLFEVLQGFRSCQRLIAQRVPESQERFEQLAVELDTVAAMVRSLTNELHPPVLDDFGFVAALHEYVDGLGEQEPFLVTVRAEAVDRQLPTEAHLTLFRITQEALRNIRQHAKARHVQIAFVQEHAGVSLMIKDDGRGFNPEQPGSGHYGL
ncbi:MAG: sensor histidine kinase, partial [Candidatus Binatia bacterium]